MTSRRFGLSGRLANDPPAWLLWTLALRCSARLRNLLIARAISAPGLQVGRDSVFRGMRNVRIGRDFRANGAVWIEAVSRYAGTVYAPLLTIGDHVNASNDLHISCIDRVTIGNGVLFGSRVYVSDHNHGQYVGASQSSPNVPPAERELGGGGPVVIEDNVWLGHNVCINGPAHIGFGAIIGANSVVRGSVPSRVIAAGAPCRVLKRHDETSASWVRTRDG